MVGAALVAQQGPGEQHVRGRDRLAIREASAGVEMKRDVASSVVGLDAFRQQSVESESLVIAARHQAFDDEPPDLLHREAPDNKRVEAVKGAEGAPDQPAALRRVGIGIGHMGEIGRNRRGAMHGDRIAFGGLGLAGARHRRQAERDREAGDGSKADTSKGGHRHARI